MNKLEDEVVISPILDDKINSDIVKSGIWKISFKPDEITEDIKKKYPSLYKYEIKFDGLIPVQCTKYSAL